MDMDLSVIIVSWNVRDFLKRCLESLYRYTVGIEFEVFVVDNNSYDASPDMVRQSFSQVNLIVNKDNLGFAKANNQALTFCSGRYILFLNPDTELLDNSLKLMVDFMDTHPEASAAGCKLIYSDGSLQHSCRHFPSLFTDLMEKLYLDYVFPQSPFFNFYRMGLWPHDTLRKVDVPYGACIIIRKQAIDILGGMDERFFMYYDEIDLCYRIKQTGGSVYFIPDINIVHHANRSSSQVSLETQQYKYRSKLLFFKKHYGMLSAWVLFINLCFNKLIVWGILWPINAIAGRRWDIGHLKSAIRIEWQEYIRFLKNRFSCHGKCDGQGAGVR
ncbi:MAG: glycosyltransferase family 2 protein [Candidatus Omnitrophica bacterium]|nr:glycosyltransferase family 2 protein [Candidatus Omnitrophota bacterium]